MTSYKDTLACAMTDLAKDPLIRFVGYNCKFGRAGGTLNGVPENQCEEMPLAENLMAGACIGLSLSGLRPILWLERFDFATCCADALVNHLLRLRELSRGAHCPAAIIRVAVGNKNVPLFTGAVHTQNFSQAFREMGFDVIELTEKSFIEPSYRYAADQQKKGFSTMVVELRDLYGL